MVDVINVQPQQLDLELYSGDGFKFKVILKNSAGAPEDVSGTVMAEVRLIPTADDPPIVEFAADLTDAYLGIVTLSLTGEQTKELSDHVSSENGKFTGVWDLQWTKADSEPRTLIKGNVGCVSDVTR